MLRVQADIFSGRPNPVWMITDPDETEDLIAFVGAHPEAVAKPGAGFTGLGYREVRIATVHDDEKRHRGVPREFAVGSTAAADPSASIDVARRLIEGMASHAEVRLLEHELTPLSGGLADIILEELKRLLDGPKPPPPPPPPPRSGLRTTVHDVQCERCTYEVSQFNPSFWNSSQQVLLNNNCYNYARNWRTDTFAQPGRAHGAQTPVHQCPNITAAALADGLKHRCDCLPDSEYPRRLMALVMAPGTGPNGDYHWYREQRGGFWGHKPGNTPARNYDNNNALVVNPETAARGWYTQFCGYFYAGRSVVIN